MSLQLLTDRMKFAFFIKSLVFPGGGAERVFCGVVNGLSDRGHDCVVVTFDDGQEEFFYQLHSSIEIERLSASTPGRSTPRRNLPRIMKSTRKIAQRYKPDAAVAFMHSTYVPVAFAFAGTGVPLVVSEHTSAAHYSGRPLQRRLARVAQQMAYAKTVVSTQVYEEHPKSWRKNLHVLANPVDLTEYAAAQRNFPSDGLILCLGGLRPEKDQLTLISAFDRVASEFPEWRLRLVGDGTERPAIEARIAQSQYRSRIELPGVIRDVAGEYAKASIVAMPSRYESLGLVAIEAMASGRPVVGFADCAGAATLIQHGVNGLLAEAGVDRARSLAESLRTLMADRGLCIAMGMRAPPTIQHYSIDAIVGQWEGLLLAAATSRANVPALDGRKNELVGKPEGHGG
ncbi:MAG: hypothetical protein B7Y80_20200 [Hyphomicrobium sp. 32-62-53]|nr:MAG: hypothetical protein B7Z29_20025 [Hyphomicrobium sp. 12-62-95]OYX97311.1 MAG: hypothetical protein B7Y80_20200 [Hyphomicrobium sp. 32-62-53]